MHSAFPRHLLNSSQERHKVPGRLCQPPGTRTSSPEEPAPPLRRGNQVSQTQPTLEPQPALRERGGWGESASLREAASPPGKSDLPSPNAKVPGGSVSRREHAHLQRNRPAPSQGEPSQSKPTNSNPSCSSGERGLGGEALLSEKRPLPPENPDLPSPERKSSRRLCQPPGNAAGSPEGTAPPLRRGNQVSQNQPTRTPTALRERGVRGERRFSQRSGLSPQKCSRCLPILMVWN